MASTRPLNILTLDGGGVRGLSSLLILKEAIDALKTRVEDEGLTLKDPITLPFPKSLIDDVQNQVENHGLEPSEKVALALLKAISAAVKLKIEDPELQLSEAKIFNMYKSELKKVLPTGLPTDLQPHAEPIKTLWRQFFQVVDRRVNDKKLQLVDDNELALQPCNLFDLIGGTSTGGFVALMLGRLRMTVEECIGAYLDFAKAIYEDKSALERIKKAQGKAIYDAKILEKKVQEIVKNYSRHPETSKILGDPLNKQACKTFVLAVCKGYVDAPPRRFRSYTSPIGRAARCQIWEAARATTAAITFFDSIEIGVPKEVFIDGALGGYNNPTEQAIAEAREVWPDRPVGCILSIGTGKLDLVKMKGNLAELAEACYKLVMNCEMIADRVARDHRGLSPNPYVRLNVEKGLEDIALDEWKRLHGDQGLAEITTAFLGEPDQQDKVDRVVEALILRVKELVPDESLL